MQFAFPPQKLNNVSTKLAQRQCRITFKLKHMLTEQFFIPNKSYQNFHAFSDKS